MDADPSTLLAARERYLRDNGFDASYEERWVKLKAGRVTFWLPNAPGRVRAVKLHDLHHLVTGYATDWTGEAEIAAWELASGCGAYGWAWALNLSALPIGLVLAPRRMLHAYARGRRSRNLYRSGAVVDDALLARPVGELRAELGLDAVAAPRARDLPGFAALGVVALAFALAPAAVLAGLVLLAV